MAIPPENVRALFNGEPDPEFSKLKAVLTQYCPKALGEGRIPSQREMIEASGMHQLKQAVSNAGGAHTLAALWGLNVSTAALGKTGEYANRSPGKPFSPARGGAPFEGLENRRMRRCDKCSRQWETTGAGFTAHYNGCDGTLSKNMQIRSKNIGISVGSEGGAEMGIRAAISPAVASGFKYRDQNRVSARRFRGNAPQMQQQQPEVFASLPLRMKISESERAALRNVGEAEGERLATATTRYAANVHMLQEVFQFDNVTVSGSKKRSRGDTSSNSDGGGNAGDGNGAGKIWDEIFDKTLASSPLSPLSDEDRREAQVRAAALTPSSAEESADRSQRYAAVLARVQSTLQNSLVAHLAGSGCDDGASSGDVKGADSSTETRRLMDQHLHWDKIRRVSSPKVVQRAADDLRTTARVFKTIS